MKILVNIVIFICASILSKAQVNIVRNGSFEKYYQCPIGIDNIRDAVYWRPIDTGALFPLCLAEYCNACASIMHVGVPLGASYYQYPRSGNAMMQAEMYFDHGYNETYMRDYLQGRLYKTLVSGRSYCVTFYVVLEEASQYAINRIGAYLDNGAIDAGQDSVGCALPQTAFIPQVFSSSIINDTLKWTKIQGSFMASGNEKFITIGNFFNALNTDTIKLYPPTGNNFSWYLVDDVSVIESTATADAGPDKDVAYGDSVWIGTNEEGMPCTWYVAGDTTPVGYSGGIWVKPTVTTTYVVEMDLCGNVTRDSVKVTVWPVGVPFDKLTVTEIKLWPNPVGDELHVEGASGSYFVLYDVVGKEVYRKNISGEHEVMNIGELQKGIYIIHISDGVTGQKVVRRIVKQ